MRGVDCLRNSDTGGYPVMAHLFFCILYMRSLVFCFRDFYYTSFGEFGLMHGSHTLLFSF